MAVDCCEVSCRDTVGWVRLDAEDDFNGRESGRWKRRVVTCTFRLYLLCDRSIHSVEVSLENTIHKVKPSRAKKEDHRCGIALFDGGCLSIVFVS